MADQTFAIEYANKFLRDCEKIKFPIDKALLFGSFAKQTQTNDSDIDIALFSTKFTDNPIENVDMIVDAWIHFPLLDIKAFRSTSDKSLMMEEILKTGIELNA